MTIPPSVPDPAAALRAALKNLDPFTSTRHVLRSFDPAASTKATIANFNPSASTKAAMANFDPTASTKAAMANFDPSAATRAVFRDFDVTAATRAKVGNFDVTASTRAALRTLDPSAALTRALASFDPASIAQMKLRTMSFQSGVDVLGIIKRMSLTTSDVPAVEVPGFDAAVRDVLTSAAAAVGASIDLPEGEIGYVRMPDLEVSLSSEFEALTASAVERHQRVEWPKMAGTAISWIAYILFILCVVQQAAPTVHEDDPTGVTDVVAEHWPEQAQLPEWFVDLYILAFAIKSERPRSAKDPEDD
ncbi:hypothetical protein [Brachybacterium alimentarium]|uniref:hypothetical protein n=1 Tax=Brachybacterium alimentarium TaxID=47845 RepID=UPI003FD3E881